MGKDQFAYNQVNTSEYFRRSLSLRSLTIAGTKSIVWGYYVYHDKIQQFYKEI